MWNIRNYFGSVIKQDEIHVKLSYRIVMATAAFKKSERLFSLAVGLRSKEEGVKVLDLEHSFVWCCNWDTSDSRP
jgi:hypothetical protein